MGVISFDFFVKLRIIKLSVAFFFVIFGIKNDYSFSFISWFYHNVCMSDELLEGFSLMFKELSPIFDGLVLRMSLLSYCIKSSNPRSRSLFGVHEFFFLKGSESEM